MPSATRPRNGSRTYLFTGMIQCTSGHGPKAMYGKVDKGIIYHVCAYARDYGDVAAAEIEGHGKWLRIREDAVLPLVEKFFAERIFGPMRLDKLERQLRAHDRRIARETKQSRKNLTKKLEDLERRIGLQVQALETGLEPQLVGKRIAELRQEREQLEAAMEETIAEMPEASMDEIAAVLGRLPDLSEELRKAPTELKRQVFEAFQLRISYDKLERRITISATVSEAIAEAFHHAKDLPEEVHRVAQRDIAGARYVPPSDARVVERIRLPVLAA